MIHLKIKHETGVRDPIVRIHYKPDALSEKERAEGILVDAIPETPNVKGKEATPYWNYELKRIEFDFVDIENQDENFVKELAETLKSAIQKYAESVASKAPVAKLKELRLSALREECTADIYAGFASGQYEFGYNAQDQDNFTKRLATIAIGSPGPFKWKSLNAGVVELTKEQFIQVVTDAEAHQLEKQERFWLLEQQVLNADTLEAIDAIKW